MIKVISVNGYETWDGKDGNKVRTVKMDVMDGEQKKSVKMHQKPDATLPKENDEFSDEYEIIEKRDNKGNDYLLLHKKSTGSGKGGYSKKEVPPRQYLINTCVPVVLPGILEKKYTAKDVMAVLDEFVEWAGK